MTVNDTVRHEARSLYHGKGRSAYRIARDIGLPLDAVLDMVRELPLARCLRCGGECRRTRMRYCSTDCYDAARAKAKAARLASQPAGGGCGCRERKLCKQHAALLDRLRSES